MDVCYMIQTCNAPLGDSLVRYSAQYKLFIVLYCILICLKKFLKIDKL